MKITLSVIKEDIGSIGGHIAPSQKVLDTVRTHMLNNSKGLVIDSFHPEYKKMVLDIFTRKEIARNL